MMVDWWLVRVEYTTKNLCIIVVLVIIIITFAVYDCCYYYHYYCDYIYYMYIGDYLTNDYTGMTVGLHTSFDVHIWIAKK